MDENHKVSTKVIITISFAIILFASLVSAISLIIQDVHAIRGTSAAYGGDSVYVGSRGGSMNALDTGTGGLQWSTSVPETSGPKS